MLKSELAGKVIEADPRRARCEIGEVEQIARKALDAAGITLKGSSQAPRLEPAQETVLSLTLREAVTNVLPHAGARRCHLELSSDRANLDDLELAALQKLADALLKLDAKQLALEQDSGNLTEICHETAKAHTH